MSFPIETIRKDFPILSREINGHRLVYLDNAATTMLPEPVIGTISEQYRCFQSNVHRGIHTLSELSTARLEKVRSSAAAFIGAEHADEIVFTSGTTASVNLICQSLSEGFINAGDEILVTVMEHHSNYIPWQELCIRKNAVFKAVGIDSFGNLNITELEAALSERTKIVAVCGVSNLLGSVNPIAEITRLAHASGALVLIDAAQLMRHERINVRELGCDFLAFSGHKLLGPTGTGVLYGKRELLDILPPPSFGGGMVSSIGPANVYNTAPFKFEAGTPNISGIIALGTAIEYICSLGTALYEREQELTDYLESSLSSLPEINIIGSPDKRSGCVSFNINNAHFFDVAALLDKLGIAVRSGHHCALPILQVLGLDGCVRASTAFYNTFDEIDELISGLKRIIPLVRGK